MNCHKCGMRMSCVDSRQKDNVRYRKYLCVNCASTQLTKEQHCNMAEGQMALRQLWEEKYGKKND